MPKSPKRRQSMTMCFGMGVLLVGCGSQPPGVQRKAVGQALHFAANVCAHLIICDVLENAGDEPCHLADFGFTESAWGDGRTSEAHAAGVNRTILIERT